MLGCVGLVGGYMWLKNDRANRPDRIWVPLQLNQEMTHEQHEEFATALREQLITDEILAAVAKDTGLQQRWPEASEQEIIADLHKRLIYEIGEYRYQPSLNIGFRGIRRENQLLRDMTERLMKDLEKIMTQGAPPNAQ